jgi:hypothetical protein
MKNLKYLLIIAVGVVFTSAIYSCTTEAESAEEFTWENKLNSDEDLHIKGKYLVNIMGCNDCHSPKKMGPMGPEIIPELMLSGYPADRPIAPFDLALTKNGISMMNPDLTAAAGPWGISFAGNLTPDATGLGNWTEVQFKKALTEGKYKGMDGTRMLLPPMPWVNYKDLKENDIQAIFRYLQSIKPVKNIVPQHIPPLVSNL